MKIYFSIFFLFWACFQVVCQNKATIDSLQQLLNTDLSDTQKTDLYNGIAKEYALNADSINVLKYTAKALDLAQKNDYVRGEVDSYLYLSSLYQSQRNLSKAKLYLEKALAKSEKAKYTEGIVRSNNGLGNVFRSKKEEKKALEYYGKSLNTEGITPVYQVKTYYDIGLLYERVSNNNKALEVYSKGIALSKKHQIKRELSKMYNRVGLVTQKQGNYDKALEYYQEALLIDRSLNDKISVSALYNNIGNVYEAKGNYPKALDYYFKSVKIDEELDNKMGVAYGYGNIGIIYDEQGNYSQALKHYLKSLKILQEIGNKSGEAIIYNNVGDIHRNQNNYAKALDYYFKSLEIKKEIKNERGMAYSYNNIGVVYQEQKKYDKALEYLQLALDIRKKNKNQSGIANSYINLGKVWLEQRQYAKAKEYLTQALTTHKKLGEKAWTAQAYVELGRVNYHQQDYLEALKNLKSGVNMAKQKGSLVFVKEGAELMAKVYAATSDFANAYQSYQLFKQMSDSLFNETNTKKLTRMEAEFGFEKQTDSLRFVQDKEKAILNTRLENEKAKREKEVLKKRLYRNLGWFAVIVLVAITLFTMFIFRSRQRQKQLNAKLTKQKDDLERQRKELMLLNQEVQESNAEISAANEEINAINETLQDTLETVQIQRDDIMSSISYAQRIQEAILPFEERMQKVFPEHFVLYKPRDIVSGDFYWCEEVEHLQILIVGDCTGHGVPGAFMTMLGSQALSNIVVQRKITKPDEILNALNETLPYLLKTKDTQINDGMDIVVSVLDRQKQQLYFAGAKNSLVLVQNGELTEIRGDIYGINTESGSSKAVVKYTAHTIDISVPTVFYMYSDGYQDQFGGKEGKKMMKRRLRERLIGLAAKPVNEQKRLLEIMLQEWMLGYPQTDDILVVGVKLN
ncbi:tetratricopeptide repeat protein [Microscilla marina]|uniref:Serine/threonine protein kinases, putative n=1 Tax=Microscilla marina ATCC 23134 TaxID=313606 RepID=A1ZKD3_MICM2|nr:tetratricopeptide repeat protein [Microscilla marina]EAY29159.1 serine/threonine protein kinases, putative [Microscilla marina ATCC 23134]